jgi:hypothetical protein
MPMIVCLLSLCFVDTSWASTATTTSLVLVVAVAGRAGLEVIATRPSVDLDVRTVSALVSLASASATVAGRVITVTSVGSSPPASQLSFFQRSVDLDVRTVSVLVRLASATATVAGLGECVIKVVQLLV